MYIICTYCIGMTWIFWRFPFLIPLEILSAILIISFLTQYVAYKVLYHFQTHTHDSMPSRLPLLLLYWDVVLLTIQLAVSAGPYNPLSFLYLLHIAIVVIVFHKRHHLTFILFIFTHILALFAYYGLDSDY